VQQDGLITLTEDEKFTRSFQETWGLSRAAAEIAARGRDRGNRAALSGVSVAELAALRPDPANVIRVVAAIEELTTALRGHGSWRKRLGMKRHSRSCMLCGISGPQIGL
jgi:hypothetical protein